MIKVGIVGGTGYTGVELLRLLSRHPSARVVTVTSRNEAGIKVADMFPSLRGVVDVAFSAPDEARLNDCDIVFFATPNGVAMNQVRGLLATGTRVVDLAADYRIRDVAEWEKWYGMTHGSPELLTEAVYGLPEINRHAIRSARLVANPGCYPTAVQLGFLPLLETDAVEPDSLIADCKSGSSGAGRKAELSALLAEAGDSIKAYAASGHRHLPEMRQGLCQAAASSVGLTFVPHLIPMLRGIHATLYARLRANIDVQILFEQRYADELFVDVLPLGSHPETRSVRGANVCRIAVHRPQEDGVVVVLSVIDNLVKGAAGQAIQNMNLMFDLEEWEGLDIVPLLP